MDLRSPSAADSGVLRWPDGRLPDAPLLEIREVQETFVDHWLEVITDVSVMQLLPPGLGIEMRKAREGARFAGAERLVQEYLTGPEPLRMALQRFVARYSKDVVLYGASSELSFFDNDMPAVDRRFVGRKEHLREIADNLLASYPRSVVIRGVPGIGKTTLARKVVADLRLQERYNVAWVSCIDVRTLDDLKRRLSRASQVLVYLRSSPAGRSTYLRGLAGADDQSTQAGKPHSKQLLIVLNRIDKLIDTYRQNSGLASFLAWLEEHLAFGRPRLLITGVGGSDLGIDTLDIDLEPLAWHEAEVLFTSFRCTSRWRDAPNLHGLVNRFAGHPLALAVAARAAPRNGDLETFVQLLQRQHSPEDDELDAAIKLLLLDSSLQAPKLRQLLRLTAHWPIDCEVEVLCAILDLPDTHTAIILADSVSRLGMLEFVEKPPELHVTPGRFFRVPQPFKDRLNLLERPSECEVSSIRKFLFKQVFQDPQWKRWASDPYQSHFAGLDELFLDAFRAEDAVVATSALEAVIAIPRIWQLWLRRPGFLHCSAHTHQLRLDTLQRASACAVRLGDSTRHVLLEVAAAEHQISVPMLPEGGGRTGIELEEELREIFRSSVQQPDRRVRLALRKCCYLLGWLSLSNACEALGEGRSRYLRQARRYPYMEGLEPVSGPLQDDQRPQLATRPPGILLDKVCISLARFHLHFQCRSFDQAYYAHLATLSALDGAFRYNVNHESAYRRIRIQLDVAALFATQGALSYASNAADLSLTSSLLPAPWPPRFEQWGLGIYPLTLFRLHLRGHKDVLSWQQLLWINNSDGVFLRLAETLSFPMDMVESPFLAADCAEHAVLAFSLCGRTGPLYRAWFAIFCFWSLAAVRDSRRSMHHLGEHISPCPPFLEERPPSEWLLSLRASIPSPRPSDLAAYHRCYAALSALVEDDFLAAASEFLVLEAICLDDLAATESHIADDPWLRSAVFSPEVRLSVFKPLFRALAEDCVKRRDSALAHICDVDAPGNKYMDEPITVAGEGLYWYIQAIAFVLVWIASCLPDINRAV